MYVNTNAVWLATRTCGPDYTHIGKHSFEHMVNLFQLAYEAIKN